MKIRILIATASLIATSYSYSIAPESLLPQGLYAYEIYDSTQWLKEPKVKHKIKYKTSMKYKTKGK